WPSLADQCESVDAPQSSAPASTTTTPAPAKLKATAHRSHGRIVVTATVPGAGRVKASAGGRSVSRMLKRAGSVTLRLKSRARKVSVSWGAQKLSVHVRA